MNTAMRQAHAKHISSITSLLASQAIDVTDQKEALAAIQNTVLANINKRLFLEEIYRPNARPLWQVVSNKGQVAEKRYHYGPSAHTLADNLNEVEISRNYQGNGNAWRNDPTAERWSVKAFDA